MNYKVAIFFIFLSFRSFLCSAKSNNFDAQCLLQDGHVSDGLCLCGKNKNSFIFKREGLEIFPYFQKCKKKYKKNSVSKKLIDNSLILIHELKKHPVNEILAKKILSRLSSISDLEKFYNLLVDWKKTHISSGKASWIFGLAYLELIKDTTFLYHGSILNFSRELGLSKINDEQKELYLILCKMPFWYFYKPFLSSMRDYVYKDKEKLEIAKWFLNKSKTVISALLLLEKLYSKPYEGLRKNNFEKILKIWDDSRSLEDIFSIYLLQKRMLDNSIGDLFDFYEIKTASY